MVRKTSNLKSRSSGVAKERKSKSWAKAPKSSPRKKQTPRPDVPWQQKVKSDKLHVLELKRSSNSASKKARHRRAKIDAGLPLTQKATWWEAVKPLFHFACLISLIYVLVFATCDLTAGHIAKRISAGYEPAGHSAFCYTLRLLDFGPLNTKDLATRALCSNLPNYTPPAS